MSDIDREVAEKVMRWFIHTDQDDDWYVTSSGFLSRLATDWHPSIRMEDAWKVVETIQKDNPGWRFDLLGGDTTLGYVDGSPSKGVDTNSRVFFGWSARFFGEADPRINYGDNHGVTRYEQTAPLAICKAALAAVETNQ